MRQFSGLCVFPGLALARIFRDASGITDVDHSFLGAEKEIELFQIAQVHTEKQIELIKEITLKKVGEKEAEIFEAHRMMLLDPEFSDGVIEEIKTKNISAAHAIHEVTERFAQMLALASNDYLRERVADFRDVAKRLIRNLRAETDSDIPDEEFIYVGVDLGPSDLMALAEKKLKGIVLAKGGTTSHASILMKAMGIPSMIGTKGIEEWLASSKQPVEEGFLNSAKGQFAVQLSDLERERFQKAVHLEDETENALKEWKTRPSRLKSGENLPLLVNVGNHQQVVEGLHEGAEGVGLYRTEFLFLERKSAPSFEEQVEIYQKAVVTLDGKPLVVRTLDIGGDKGVSYLNLPHEENPFLGVRGLRLCFEHPGLFEVQMRALIQASESGPIEVMFPMVTTPQELERAFAIIEPMKTAKMNIRWGMMLEVPQNIFMIPELSQYVDFFSVGTNDLTQYLTASDRQNPNVQDLNDFYSPGVLRAMAYLAAEVKRAGRELSICGEMAADQKLLPFTVGLGVNKLSMSARMITRQRKALSSVTSADCVRMVEHVLMCKSREDVLRTLEK